LGCLRKKPTFNATQLSHYSSLAIYTEVIIIKCFQNLPDFREIQNSRASSKPSR